MFFKKVGRRVGGGEIKTAVGINFKLILAVAK
jgi:hypothetical protein